MKIDNYFDINCKRYTPTMLKSELRDVRKKIYSTTLLNEYILDEAFVIILYGLRKSVFKNPSTFVMEFINSMVFYKRSKKIINDVLSEYWICLKLTLPFIKYNNINMDKTQIITVVSKYMVTKNNKMLMHLIPELIKINKCSGNMSYKCVLCLDMLFCYSIQIKSKIMFRYLIDNFGVCFVRSHVNYKKYYHMSKHDHMDYYYPKFGYVSRKKTLKFIKDNLKFKQRNVDIDDNIIRKSYNAFRMMYNSIMTSSMLKYIVGECNCDTYDDNNGYPCTFRSEFRFTTNDEKNEEYLRKFIYTESEKTCGSIDRWSEFIEIHREWNIDIDDECDNTDNTDNNSWERPRELI